MLQCTPLTYFSPAIVFCDPGLGGSPHEAAPVYRIVRRAILRRSEGEMALLRQLQGRAFDPAVVNVMVTAFGQTLRELKLSSRRDPLVERGCATLLRCGIVR